MHRKIVMGNASITDGKINYRENRRGNQQWTTQRNLQHWLHNTQGEDEHTQKRKNKTQTKLKQWLSRTQPSF